MFVLIKREDEAASTWHSDCFQKNMNTQQKLSITYKGQQVKVTPFSNGVDTFFTVHLPGNELRVKLEYIHDNPCWVENDGVVTKRSEELGRLIEETDGR
jgi:hypothetical protein